MMHAEKHIRAGDDLEDDFIPDNEFSGWASELSGSDAEMGDVVIGTKRSVSDQEQDSNSGKASKSAKQKRRKRGRRGLLERSEDTPMTARAQADYFLRCIREARRGISEIEIEEIAFRPEHFIDTTEFEGDHNIVDIEQFLSSVATDVYKKCTAPPIRNKANGQPILIIVSSSGIRCTDVIRALPEIHKRSRVAKLFAKHFKVPEQVEYLRTNDCRAAAGTPNRLVKLADEENALDLSQLALVVLDRHRDSKQRTMFDIPEIRTDLLTMFEGSIGQRIRSGNAKIVVF